MIDKKYKLNYEGLYFAVSSASVIKMYPLEKAMNLALENAPLVLDFLRAGKWTFCFVPFRIPDEEGMLDAIYFTIDYEAKEIYLNMYILAEVDLVEHYLLYASLCAYEHSIGYSLCDATIFNAAFAMEARKFIELSDDIVQKELKAFENNDVDVVEDGFCDILKFEYLAPHKYLYAAYAKMILEPDEFKNECIFTADYLEGTLW